MSKDNVLRDLVKEIAELEPRAGMDLREVPTNQRPGMGIAKRQAEDRLEAARKEYREAVIERSAGVVLEGAIEDQEKFAAFVMLHDEGVVVAADEFYRRLAESFHGTIGPSCEFGQTQQQLFNLAWRGALRDLGIDPSTAREPNFARRRVPDFEAAVRLASDLAEGSAGQLPNQLYINATVARLALASRYKDSILPVVVVGAGPDDKFSFGRGYGRAAVGGEKPTAEGLKAVFAEAARQMKKDRAQKGA
jgi:hypothetical protein